MLFTYDSYSSLITLLKTHGYTFVNYDTCQTTDGKCVIMRHDIDNHPSCSLELAKLEHSHNVKSVYFALLTSDFYNVFSRSNRETLREIISLGHEIGLHFDTAAYPNADTPEQLITNIRHEAQLLSEATGSPVRFVSMHRPSPSLIEADLSIPGMYNAYSKQFCGRGGGLLSSSTSQTHEDTGANPQKKS